MIVIPEYVVDERKQNEDHRFQVDNNNKTKENKEHNKAPIKKKNE